MATTHLNPAEIASEQCLSSVYEAIAESKNFLVEAGAGAGKTYTLIKALKKLIESNGPAFIKSNKRIACITYTNVAKDEIKARTDNHPVVFTDTIHAFAWEAIKGFQKDMRPQIANLTDRWAERIDEIGGINNQTVIYNLGYPKITETEIFLHHDDVIKLLIYFLDDLKFRIILSRKFPVILIDEYQDTNKELANSLLRNFIHPSIGPLFGFFGDHWQKIYGSDSIGLISANDDKLRLIGKHANFRSDRIIVDALNKIRPALFQHVKDPLSNGEITIYHSNTWQGERRNGNHWKDDLPENIAHDYLQKVRTDLERKGWNFNNRSTKILMLTHNVLASEQGYKNLLDVIGSNDLQEKNDDYFSFFTDVIEPGIKAFESGKFGEMLSIFNTNTQFINKHSDKIAWDREINKLLKIRTQGTIGEVIRLLNKTKKPRLPNKIFEKERDLFILCKQTLDKCEESEQKFVTRMNKLRSIQYSEVIYAIDFFNDNTLFSTKHGVKGAQFENVLVVLGRGWNQYNWNQMLEWANSNIPIGKEDSFERNRNLFYVACSRPQKKLAMLFTQYLSVPSLNTLTRWFGDVIVPLT